MPIFCKSEQWNNEPGSVIRSRLLKGIGAQGFSQVVQIFIRLAEVPLFLSFWGTGLYGEWLILSAIPVYLTISDVGFTGAACREMTMRSGAGNRNGTLVIFQSTWVLLIVVSMAAGLLAFGLAQVVPLRDWLGFSIMNDLDTRVAFLLLVVYVLVGFQGGLINGGFWITGRYSSSIYFTAVVQFLEFAGLVIALAFGGGPIQAACGYLCGRLLGIGLMWLGQLRVSPWLRHGMSHASLSEIKRIATPAFASLAFPIGNALNIQGVRLVVGLVLGPNALAVFVPLRTLSRLVMQPAIITKGLLEPELALAYGAGDERLFQRLFEKSSQLALWGCLTATLIVGLSAHWIFPEWTGGKVTMHWPTFLVLIFAVLINSIWHTALMVPYATNRHGRIALYYVFVYGVTAFCLGFIGANALGLGGAAFALLIVEAAMSIAVMHESLKMTCVSMSQWFRTIVYPPFDVLDQAAMIMKKRVTIVNE